MPCAVGRAGRLAGRRPPSSLPVDDRAAGGVVDVLPQEHLVRGVGGVGLALVHPGRVGVGRVLDRRLRRGARDVAVTPSGPGWFWARVSTMNRSAERVTVVAALPAMRSGPAISGSSALSGTKTVPPLLTVWSTPWSKNWPKSVNMRVVRRREPDVGGDVGDEQGLVRGHAARRNAVDRRRRQRVGSVVQGNTPGLPCVRTGNPAAATAAGLVEVWSTIRLLIVRGWESKTLPVFCV